MLRLAVPGGWIYEIEWEYVNEYGTNHVFVPAAVDGAGAAPHVCGHGFVARTCGMCAREARAPVTTPAILTAAEVVELRASLTKWDSISFDEGTHVLDSHEALRLRCDRLLGAVRAAEGYRMRQRTGGGCDIETTSRLAGREEAALLVLDSALADPEVRVALGGGDAGTESPC